MQTLLPDTESAAGEIKSVGTCFLLVCGFKHCVHLALVCNILCKACLYGFKITLLPLVIPVHLTCGQENPSLNCLCMQEEMASPTVEEEVLYFLVVVSVECDHLGVWYVVAYVNYEKMVQHVNV